MEPIRIKTKVSEISLKLREIELNYNEDSFFKRMVKRLLFRKIKKETVKIPVPADFEPLSIDILDEVDIYKWMMREVQIGIHPINYKKDLVAEDKNGDKFILHGCFPVEISSGGKKAKIVYDYFTVIKGEYIND